MSRDYILHPAHAPRDLHIDYAGELNDQQLAAVTARGETGSLDSGPMLVIAGAGSGKTRTLTYRVAWLVEQGIAPDRILLLTFTNKAAKEMLRRVEGLLPTDISAIWGGTFHHIGNRLLRRHADLVGYDRDFTIMDREDQKDLLETCLSEAKINTKEERFPKGNVLADIYSLALNTETSVEAVLAAQYDYFAHLADRITKLQQVYHARKRAANAMDYDDLLVHALALLRDQPELAARYRDKFQHVLVDEYQDTNRIQADLIDAIAGGHGNLMVVGDDAQSIYSWRGADYRNILGFPDRYPGARTFKIEVNYRSLPPILRLANAAIAGNALQFEKQLQPVREGGGKPWLVAAADANQQAQFVAQRIVELRDEGVNLSDTAVLYRAHYQAMEIQMELTRHNIPFVITSGLRFFEQAHVKDVSCFLKLAVNGQDEVAFKRVVRLLPGIGPAAAGRMWRALQASLAVDLAAPAGRSLPREDKSVPKKAAAEWKHVATVLNDLRALENHNIDEMIELVLEGYYQGYLEAKYPNARSRLEDLYQLASFGMQFGSVEEFLSQLALLTNLEADDATLLAGGDNDSVRMSTVHQAKGQEWDAVFVVGLSDGMFPLGRALDTEEGVEEERRLFYVAVTRAKNELYLAYPLMKAGGRGGPAAGGFQRPSRFVADLPPSTYQELSLRYQSRGRW